MRRSILLLLCALLTPAAVSAQAAAARPTSADSAAIEAALGRWYRAWEARDAALGAQDYTEDAEWTNAFGMRRQGRAAIEATLREVFALRFVVAGESRATAEEIRWLGPDVALVVSRVERAGQQTPTGASLGTRQTTHHRVFVRAGGVWRIASHLISDARDRQQASH
jgi:uncharacterized protein (TIGR02246 family)